MNFRRAGVAKKMSRTSITGPWAAKLLKASGCTGETWPASMLMAFASVRSGGRETIDRRAIAPMDGKASPRKPSVPMDMRSSSPVSSTGSFDVAWRSIATRSSSADMPQPSSAMRISDMPALTTWMWMFLAPASIAFSTNSFRAEAGRSTTSPAAMRLMVPSVSLRILTGRLPGTFGSTACPLRRQAGRMGPRSRDGLRRASQG